MGKGKSGLSTTAAGGIPPQPQPQVEPEDNEPKHPVVTDINAFGSYNSHKDKIDWLKAHHSEPLSDAEADAIISAAEHYSNGGYGAIHNGKSKKEQDLIDKMINDAKAPVYGKNVYRGLAITKGDTHGMDPKQYVMNIINAGVWKEPGISSFSATKTVAMGGLFGEFGSSNPSNKDKVHILITYKGHKTGMPFKHISVCSSEDEVLMPSSIKKGLKITKWHTNKAGNEFFIDVDDL